MMFAPVSTTTIKNYNTARSSSPSKSSGSLAMFAAIRRDYLF
jgi:hypothetical protein